MKEKIRKLSYKGLAIIIAIAVLVLAISGILTYLFLQIPIKVNIDAIESVGTDVMVKEATESEPVSLYKLNEAGEISDEPFKILGFTDTHFDTYRKKGAYTMKYMVANIQEEKPDLVVFVGDLVTSAFNRKRAHQLAQVMEKLGVYWITVLGNHEGDNKQSITRKEFVDIYASYDHSLIENDTKKTANGEELWGYGNTQINILTTGGKVSQSLFFLDSGDRVSATDVKERGLEEGSYDYVKPSQVQWYTERVQELGEGVKSMIFVHIALYEYRDAVLDAPRKKDDSFDFDTVSEDGTWAEFGDARESISSADFSNGFFDIIQQLGSTQAIVVGHDHVNTFRIRYKDVWLCYNRNSGYSSYNVITRGDSELLEQGASLYTIESDGSLVFGDILNRERYAEDMAEVVKLYKPKKK